MADSIKAFFSEQGIEKKLFFGILISGLAWISYEAYTVYSINKQRHKTLRPTVHVEQGQEECLEISGSLENKPRQVVAIFVNKMAKDEVLSKFFHPRTLQPHSLYAVILEKYMTEALLDGKDPVMPLNMKEIHKGYRIRKEHFDKWVKLWREAEKEVGVQTKPDLWKDFQNKLVTDK